MSHFININKIIEAFILKPYENCGESWDTSTTSGWQAVLVTGYREDGYPIKIIISQESESDCIKFLKDLGLEQIS